MNVRKGFHDGLRFSSLELLTVDIIVLLMAISSVSKTGRYSAVRSSIVRQSTVQ